MILKGKDLIEIGFAPGPELGRALAHANKALAQGRAWESVRAETLLKFPKIETPKKGLRQEALSVGVACSPEGDEEHSNVEASLARIREISRVPVVEAAALMPDTCPSGREWGSMPVGGAISTRHHVLPAAHSADINCGMCCSFFISGRTSGDLVGMMKRSCLFGPFPADEHLRVRHPVLEENVWSNPFLSGLEDEAINYLGTQGDGNHFSYLGQFHVSGGFLRGLEGAGHYELARNMHGFRGELLWSLVTHHGSRQLGAKVYRRGISFAEKETAKIAEGIPKNGSWIDLDSVGGLQYWEALGYVGRWTEANHQVVHDRFLELAGTGALARISNHHNAVWKHGDRVYHGKGATPGWPDDGRDRLGIIPLNMGREILLVFGSDNKQFLSFAPHGAGRNKSRSALKKEFSNPSTGEYDAGRASEALSESTEGLQVEWASGSADISESPLAYKDPDKIRRELQDFGLARIAGEIRPRGCIMAGEFPRWGKGLSKGKKVSVDKTRAWAAGKIEK